MEPHPDQYQAPMHDYGGQPYSDPRYMEGGYSQDGYGGGVYGDVYQGGNIPPGPPNDTMASGQAYQQYTEGARHKGGLDNTIDAETGIAPPRLTDCVCLVLFLIYVLAMLVFLAYVTTYTTVGGKPYSDPRRLTHGFNFRGQLCGVDEEVINKPFLYWCRSEPIENSSHPQVLNDRSPTCIDRCPDMTYHQEVPCLFPEAQIISRTSPSKDEHDLPASQFGNEQAYHLQSQQSIAMTQPYPTFASGGRFCLPLADDLQAVLLAKPKLWVNQETEEPLDLKWTRSPMYWKYTMASFGSLQNCWGILFGSSLLAIALGYLFVLAVGFADFARPFVYGFIWTAFGVFLVSGLFFLYAIVDAAIMNTGRFDEYLDNIGVAKEQFDIYQQWNPFYARGTGFDAALTSTVLGVFLLLCSCAMCGTFTHVGHSFRAIHELIRAATDVVMQVQSMMVPPAIEALFKYLLMWFLLSHCTYFLTCGWIDDHRVEINGRHYKGISAKFYNDERMLFFGMLFWTYGTVWIIELCTATGQFLISHATVSWYFSDRAARESRVLSGKQAPALIATLNGIVFYHIGSLCLGAAIIPWTRFVRLFNWVDQESVPDKKAQCCENSCTFLTSCCRNIGSCCDGIRDFRNSLCMPDCASKKGCSYAYTKNAYIDVILRSQHFLPAAQRSVLLVQSHKPCQKYMWGCQIVSVVGVLCIGMICSAFTYMLIIFNPAYSEATNSDGTPNESYITDPILVAMVGFVLCGNIAYGFTALIDHTADTLLHCYAYHRKFNMEACAKYCPDSIKFLVQLNTDRRDGSQYGYYGRAPTNMYLSSWLPSKKKKAQNQVTASGNMMSAGGTGSMMGSMPGGSRDLGPGQTGMTQDPYQYSSGMQDPGGQYSYPYGQADGGSYASGGYGGYQGGSPGGMHSYSGAHAS